MLPLYGRCAADAILRKPDSTAYPCNTLHKIAIGSGRCPPVEFSGEPGTYGGGGSLMLLVDCEPLPRTQTRRVEEARRSPGGASRSGLTCYRPCPRPQDGRQVGDAGSQESA